MTIISRVADNDVEAILTAQAMESAGADVFSVTYNGKSLRPGSGIDSSRFIVWAKYSEAISIDLIDAAIDARINEMYGENSGGMGND